MKCWLTLNVAKKSIIPYDFNFKILIELSLR